MAEAAGRASDGPVVVKLGGSLITRKGEVEKLRPKVLRRLAHELAEAGTIPLVVLHGAGSFGHPGAARFGLARPPPDDRRSPERVRGAAIVAGEVRRLHLAVLRELVAAGLSAWSLPLSTLGRNRAGTLAELDTAAFARALDGGWTPVSGGDVVADEAWGASILSADTAAVELARRLHARRVVFATDVPGVLEGPPAGRRKVAAEVTDELVAGLRPRPGAVDVTGGIRAKIQAMLEIARAGADAALISGLTDGAVSRAVRGDVVYGSWAHARAP
jgi:isopentenyl phosphate kinase